MFVFKPFIQSSALTHTQGVDMYHTFSKAAFLRSNIQQKQ